MNWNRCDSCGRFVSFKDLEGGQAEVTIWTEMIDEFAHIEEGETITCAFCLEKDKAA